MLLIGRINFLLGLHYSRDAGFIIKSGQLESEYYVI